MFQDWYLSSSGDFLFKIIMRFNGKPERAQNVWQYFSNNKKNFWYQISEFRLNVSTIIKLILYNLIATPINEKVNRSLT